MSHSNIGAMLSRTGDLAGARAACGKALAIQQKLADANPSVTAFQIELARSHYNIGILLSHVNRPGEACCMVKLPAARICPVETVWTTQSEVPLSGWPWESGRR